MIFRIFPKLSNDYSIPIVVYASKTVYDKTSNDYYIEREKHNVEGQEKPIRGMACIFLSDWVTSLVPGNVPFAIYHYGFFIKHMKFKLIEI